MSKSLKRVEAALTAAGISYDMTEMDVETRTAQQAADAVRCEVDQIAKSIILQGEETGELFLFITAGGNTVEQVRTETLAGEVMVRPDVNIVRKVTGFAVGGISPVGHKTPITAFIDPRLLEFDTVWAAGGTPRHVFSAKPEDIRTLAKARISDFTC